MGVSGGPYIVRDSSLVLELDAADRNSYVSGSSTWRDLTGNSNIATLINGPSFNFSNLGSIIFDGTNDNAPITGSLIFITNPNLSQENKTNPMPVLNWYPIYDNFTMEFICNPSASITIRSEATSGTAGIGGQRYITENTKSTNGVGNGAALVSIGTNAIQVFDHGDGYMPCLLSYEININSITSISVTYNQKSPSLYVNGIFRKTGLQSLKTNVELAAFGNGICSSFYTPFSGNIYNIRYYNRTLSTSEIQQNYNATKTRFGL